MSAPRPRAESIEFREFSPADYDGVMRLWRETDGLTLRDVDDREPLTRYLLQHHGLSFVAVDGGEIVGALLCGTDGRRGYLQHVAVAPGHRRRGIARAMVARSLEALSRRGIDKCHLMVIAGNAPAKAFWARLGWAERNDVQLMSHVASGRRNA